HAAHHSRRRPVEDRRPRLSTHGTSGWMFGGTGQGACPPPDKDAVTILPPMHWNPLAAPWLVVGIVLVTLAIVIYRRQRASRVAVLFCGMIGLVALWFAGFAGMLLATAAGTATGWGR